jgi:putative flavoprotein involved in K+ transport
VDGDEMSEHVNTVVVGGGQAGLSASWHLKQSGREHVILDRGTIGDTWRRRWDSFCLVTPNWLCQLPGFPYDGDDPDGFMVRDDIVSYVERFAASFGPPCRGGVEVRSLRVSRNGGRFTLDTSEGTLNAENVVVATGPFQRPDFPGWTGKVADDIEQIHTADYHNTAEPPDGGVLVVGSGQSGAQIAEDLHADGREVHLCVGGSGHTVRQYRGRDLVDWMWDSGMIDVPIHQHPEGPAIRFRPMPLNSGRDGGHSINLRKLALDGIKLHGRALDADGHAIYLASDLAKNLDAADAFFDQVRRRIDTYIERAGIEAPAADIEPVDWRPELEGPSLDLKQAGITSVIFGTGYRFEYDWIDLPVFDDNGYPRYDRGVTDIPGLYFVGLHWLYTLGSGTFGHVGRDAEYIVDHINRGM